MYESKVQIVNFRSVLYADIELGKYIESLFFDDEGSASRADSNVKSQCHSMVFITLFKYCCEIATIHYIYIIL